MKVPKLCASVIVSVCWVRCLKLPSPRGGVMLSVVRCVFSLGTRVGRKLFQGLEGQENNS